MAYREKRRRESTQENVASTKKIDTKSEKSEYFGITTSTSTSSRPTPGLLPTPAQSNTNLYQSMLRAETALYTPPTPGEDGTGTDLGRRPSQERRRYEKEESEMFSKLEKPRVRYDVEVISKLIVYAGERYKLYKYISCIISHDS